MKKMFVVSLVLAAALAVGCSKKNPSTMPAGDNKTETKKEGEDKGMGGAGYGEKTDGGDAPADPCAAPN